MGLNLHASQPGFFFISITIFWEFFCKPKKPKLKEKKGCCCLITCKSRIYHKAALHLYTFLSAEILILAFANSPPTWQWLHTVEPCYRASSLIRSPCYDGHFLSQWITNHCLERKPSWCGKQPHFKIANMITQIKCAFWGTDKGQLLRNKIGECVQQFVPVSKIHLC